MMDHLYEVAEEAYIGHFDVGAEDDPTAPKRAVNAVVAALAAMPQPEPGTEWRYEIKYGPEGEANYAWLYKGKEFVATMQTHHAMNLCKALAAVPQPEPVAYLHTLHMELGQTSKKVNFRERDPFGQRGHDYSLSYHVTTQPLYTTPPNDRDAEIERLKADLAKAVEAIEPFSKIAGCLFERNFNKADKVNRMTASDGGDVTLNAGDFFRARAALAEIKAGDA